MCALIQESSQQSPSFEIGNFSIEKYLNNEFWNRYLNRVKERLYYDLW